MVLCVCVCVDYVDVISEPADSYLSITIVIKQKAKDLKDLQCDPVSVFFKLDISCKLERIKCINT